MFEKRYILLHAQKKKVYDILREAGLEPAEFSWALVEIVDKIQVSRLNYRDGQKYYFQFSSYEVNSWSIACPGIFRTKDQAYPRNWEEQEGIVRSWARTLKTELDTPDPWAELAKYRLVVNGELSGDVPNEPIAAVEAEEIGQALMRLADGAARDLALGDDQAALLRAKLAYAADAARRERSRDWVYSVVGVWASTAVALALTEEQAATLWRSLKCELGSFVNLLLDRVVTPSPQIPIAEIKSGTPVSHPEQTRKLS